MNFGTQLFHADRSFRYATPRRWRVVRFALAIAAVLTSPMLLANNGDLDTSFNGGLFLVWPGISDPSNSDGRASVVQPDGSVLAVGGALHAGDWDWALVRRTADGSADASFGGGTGQAFLGVGARYTDGIRHGNAFGVLLQPSGKAITVGSGISKDHSSSKPHMIRWNTDGTVDVGFGVHGDVTEAMTDLTTFSGPAAQEDGKILVAGTKGGDSVIFRYTSNGRPDPGFGTGGFFEAPGYIPAGHPGNLSVLPDGSVVYAVGVSGHIRVELVKLTKDGALDMSFGSGGYVLLPLNVQKATEVVAIQPDGKIVGVICQQGLSGFTLFRLLGNGNFDTTFHQTGRISINGIIPYALALLPTGQALVSGNYVGPEGKQYLAVARITADGKLDKKFTNSEGQAGIVLQANPDPNALAVGDSIEVQPDGSFVVAGYTNTGNVVQFLMARYKGNHLRLRPADVAFSNISGVPASTVQVSDVVTISSLTDGAWVPIQVVDGSYSINGNPFTTLLGYVKNGDQVMVEHTSAATSGTSVTTHLKVGGINDSNNPWLIRGTRSFATFTSTTQ